METRSPEVAMSNEPIVTEKPTEVEKVEEKKAPAPTNEEVIIFSDNHSIDDYVIGKQIGQGAYALVFLGMCAKTNQKVALKIYEKEKMKDIQR